MTILTILIPVTLCMGVIGLAAFFWSLRGGQYEDLTGDAARILYDEDVPLPSVNTARLAATTKETTK